MADRHFSSAVLAIEAVVAGHCVVLAALELVAPFSLAVQSAYSDYLAALGTRPTGLRWRRFGAG